VECMVSRIWTETVLDPYAGEGDTVGVIASAELTFTTKGGNKFTEEVSTPGLWYISATDTSGSSKSRPRNWRHWARC